MVPEVPVMIIITMNTKIHVATITTSIIMTMEIHVAVTIMDTRTATDIVADAVRMNRKLI
jgi:hypothetical protein